MYYDTCMGHACISIIGTTGMPELADRLLNYYCTLLAWLVVATIATMNRLTLSSPYDCGRLMSV